MLLYLLSATSYFLIFVILLAILSASILALNLQAYRQKNIHIYFYKNMDSSNFTFLPTYIGTILFLGVCCLHQNYHLF